MGSKGDNLRMQGQAHRLFLSAGTPCWSMSHRIMERAFELARSGECAGLSEIKRALILEGYEGVQSHISGPTLMKQLTGLCDKSKP
jgi:hypothetical protein